VLAHLPARPAQPLTVRQVMQLSLPDSTLTHGHPNPEVSQWDAQMQRGPGNAGAAPASAIYLPIGSWPAAGGQLAEARFDLALSAAEWAVRLPGTSASVGSAVEGQCVLANQAREAVAIWLAIGTAQLPAGELQAGLNAGPGPYVHGSFVPVWNYPGVGGGYVMPPGGGAQDTAAGYLLTKAMTSLPVQKVSHVLAGAWGRWLNWRTTDAQLAAALGIRMPSVPVPSISTQVTLPSGRTITPSLVNGPPVTLCTT
jgi:hypothetical protein